MSKTTRHALMALKCGCCKRILLTARDVEMQQNASVFCEECWPHLTVTALADCPHREATS